MNKKTSLRFSNTINIKNRRAKFEFELTKNYVAGLVLKGTEIKSIRESKANIQDAYCYFNKGELFAKNIRITPYSQGSFYNHIEDRDRKLLLQKRELYKLNESINEKGMSIVPIRLFINTRGLAKLEIALGKGKKLFDKRNTIKEKDVKRDLDRMFNKRG